MGAQILLGVLKRDAEPGMFQVGHEAGGCGCGKRGPATVPRPPWGVEEVATRTQALQTRFDYGDSVRITRSVRNDGTCPGLDIGNLLVRRGSVGFVMNVGAFLQDQIIYTVNFLDQDRIVGCREEELIGASSIPSRTSSCSG